jgi:hypothetical protein
LQTQIQKYNTQSNYWRKICRQIEDGTYQKHVDIAKRRTAEREARASLTAAPAAPPEEEQPAVPTYELSMEDFDIDKPLPSGQPAAPGNPAATDMLDDPFSEGLDDSALESDKLAGDESPRAVPPLPKSDRRSPTTARFRSIPSMLPRPAAPSVSPSEPAAAKQSNSAPAAVERTAAARPRSGPDEDRMKKIYRTFLAAKKKCNEPTDGLSYDKIKRSLAKQVEAKKGDVDFKVVIKGGKAAIRAVKK